MYIVLSFMPKTLPAGEVVLADTWVICVAMGQGTKLSLEADFKQLGDGLRTSVLAEILLFCPGSHVCRSAVSNQLFRTDACLDRSKPTLTLLNATFTMIQGTPWLKYDDSTRCFQHETLTAECFRQNVEVCSGIGAVGTGYAKLGVETICYCDINPTFCNWLSSKHGDTKKIIQGDIKDHSVIHDIAKAAGKPFILTAGIACQPYSYLGDRREGLDERSESLPSTLKLGYYTRSPIILLECTQGAMHSTYVQSTLQEFVKLTGYHMHQTVVRLDKTWPSNRTRWWCVLSYPLLQVQNIPQMPSLDVDLQISHLMQIQPILDEHAMDQLCLSSHESKHFHEQKGGITKSLINKNGTMPTATHSWGSQTQACKCGCRKSGFSQERLLSKGLYGVLVPLGSTYVEDEKVYHATRHPDPHEMAILVGLSPTYLKTQDEFELRFLMAGVGQCASPLQGAWILGNILHNLKHLGTEFDFPDPRIILRQMGLDLTSERFQHWNNQEHTIKTKVFVHELQRLCHRWTAQTSVPPPTGDESCSGTTRDTDAQVTTEFDDPTSVCSVQDELWVTQTKAADLFPDDSSFHSTGASFAADSTHSESLAFVHSVHRLSVHQQIAFAVGNHPAVGPKPSVAPHIAYQTEADSTSKPIHPMMPYSADGALLAFANKRKTDFHHCNHDDKTTSRPEKQQKTEIEPHSPPESDVPLAQQFSPSKEPEVTFTTTDFHPDHDETTAEAVVSPTQEWTHPAVAEDPSPSPGPVSSQCTREPGTPVHKLFKPPPPEGVPCTKISDPTFFRNTIWVGLEREPLHKSAMIGNPTLGQLAQAAKSLTGSTEYFKPLSAVGSDLALSASIQDWQTTLLRPVAFEPYKCPKSGCDRQPNLIGLPRVDALWNQMGWVAVDEMRYYLQWFDKPDHPTSSPLTFKGLPDDPILLGSWVMTAVEKAFALDSDYSIATALFIDDHWMPIHLKVSVTNNHLTFFTTSSDEETLRNLTSVAFGGFEFDIQSKPMLSQFPADCGFQALAFIVGMGSQVIYPKPLTPEEATSWRRMFAEYLRSQDKDQDVVLSIRLGGMPDGAHHRDLINLLESHGVAKQRSTSLANQLHQAIGHAGIQATMGSSRQWRDLKARASACKPPIQLIMDDELQAQIEKRRQEGKPWGRKSSKAKQSNRPTPPQQIHLRANQIQIPDNIFKQDDGVPVNQITLQQLRQRTRGIAILNQEDAAPFLQLKEPLSPEGVGLLIVDYKELALPAHHTVITFPASFAETSDPMIVTAALVQLGAKSVTRLMPPNPVTIEQVDTQVIRCVLYRDQFPGEWTQVTDRPFKTIRGLDSLKDLTQPEILDCWDRQFMNKNFQKVKPEVAEVFSITCRFTQKAAAIVLAANAQSGLFTEPRAQHGRDPCHLHKVVWLPKKSFAEALVAQQVTEVSTSIARSGDRFGLRTLSDHVEKVHAQNRPGVAYLDNSTVKQYQVSPLPFGTTKQSLQKVCDTWSWSARPSHTLGLTADKSGLIWIVSASEPPKFWIWTMSHGDVLISEMAKKHTLPPIKEQPVIASQKTLQHLLEKSTQQPSKQDGSDPWLSNDPWKPVPSSVTTAAITNSQIATMEANIERRLKSSIQELAVPTKSSDEPMDSEADTRIQRLETQVTQLQESLTGLTTTVGSFQQQQHTVNQQMNHQVQQLKTHLDNQTKSVQTMLDSKLEDQMSRIERLLSLPEKRAKTATTNE